MFASFCSAPMAFAIVILGVFILGAKGIPEEPEEFKYVVGIFDHGSDINPSSFLCAGTIISEYHVLTAGLCVLGSTANELFVVGGVRNFFGNDVEVRAVEKLIKHPNLQANDGCYHCSRIAKNNIGLIVLKRSMKPELIEGSLQQLKLPNQLVTTEPCTVVIAGNELYDPWVLRKAEHPLVDLVQCQIPSTPVNTPVEPEHPFLQFDDQFLCAQHQTVAICPNGLGSPLVNNGSIVGVSSAGRCQKIGAAYIYSNVYFHREWILRETLPYLCKEIPNPAVARKTYNIDLEIEVECPK